jgi:hypothetical protein
MDQSLRGRGGALEGWRLLGLIAAAVAAMTVAIIVAQGFAVEGLRMAIRATARTSLLLFLLAYTASALARLRPGAWTRWQLRNRRFLGLGFATSHFIHAFAVLAFALADPAGFRAHITLGTLVVALPAYAFIVAMAATSFDATAAWLGPRAWRVLHTTGAHLVWFTFAGAVGMRAGDAFYWPLLALLLAALGVRLAAWCARPAARRLTPAAPAAAALPRSSAT